MRSSESSSLLRFLSCSPSSLLFLSVSRLGLWHTQPVVVVVVVGSSGFRFTHHVIQLKDKSVFFSFFLWLLFLRRYIAFILRFIICFGDTTRIGLHPLMLKKAHQFSPHFSSCLFKAPPPEDPVCSDWSAHTCLTYNNSRAAVLNQFFHDKLAVLYYANVLHGDVAWCHKVWN